jgi:hypothetical protein
MKMTAEIPWNFVTFSSQKLTARERFPLVAATVRLGFLAFAAETVERSTSNDADLEHQSPRFAIIPQRDHPANDTEATAVCGQASRFLHCLL